MAFDKTPWFIGGGAHHSPDVARLLAYAASGGSEGVIHPADLKVAQTLAPSGYVDIAPGAAAILNRSSGGEGQSYVMRAPTTTQIPITATAGAGRSDLVIIRVEDPQFAPWPIPVDPVEQEYVVPYVVQGVPADTLDAAELDLGYSAIALARIDIPVSTTNITTAMITDLRRLSQQHVQRAVVIGDPTDDVTLTHAGPTYIQFPDVEEDIYVPAWATHAIITAHIVSLGVVDADVTGNIRAVLGTINGAPTLYNLDHPDSDYRTTLMTVADLDVQAVAGTIQTLQMSAFRNTGTGALKTRGGTSVIFDVHFEQRVV